jgi:hypothetical protein
MRSSAPLLAASHSTPDHMSACLQLLPDTNQERAHLYCLGEGQLLGTIPATGKPASWKQVRGKYPVLGYMHASQLLGKPGEAPQTKAKP